MTKTYTQIELDHADHLTQHFLTISKIFKASPEHKAMEETVEDSPWHRESNVAVHTKMVMTEYLLGCLKRYEILTPQRFAGAIACMFHDIAKPACMVMKFKEDRGHYKAFYGHEKKSARMFLDFVARHKEIKDIFTELGADILYITAWMIEYHLPWSIVDKVKRDNILATVHRYLGDPEIFINVLLADTYGRTSDDAETKRAKAQEWAQQFRQDYTGKEPAYQYQDDRAKRILGDNESPEKIAYVLIGPSGCGKTTLINHVENIAKRCNKSLGIFSLDALRLERYGSDYSVAFQKSCSDKHFNAAAKDRFLNTIREGNDIFVLDNTNRTKKVRGRDVIELQNRGYFVVGLHLVTSLQTVVDRQKSRTDKSVPEDAVTFQYFDIELPSVGEFDAVSLSWGE